MIEPECYCGTDSKNTEADHYAPNKMDCFSVQCSHLKCAAIHKGRFYSHVVAERLPTTNNGYAILNSSP
jgi:hypothetical protein